MKCHVRIVAGGPIIEEGLGEANTLEAQNANKNAFTLKNTVLKMAKKRALVDAALAIGRLSDLFTQDIDDDPKTFTVSSRGGGGSIKADPDSKYYCKEHDTDWFKRGKMRGYAHPIDETGKWCNMPEEAEVIEQVPDDEPIFSDDDFIINENMLQKDLEKACKSQGWTKDDLNDVLEEKYQAYLKKEGHTPYMAWSAICSVNGIKVDLT